MIALRSAALTLAVLLLTIPYAGLALATFAFAPMTRYRLIRPWAATVTRLARLLCGIDFKVVGAENIPDRPAVVLAKHQSAWETFAFQVILPPHAYVLKRELLRLPFFGWGLAQFPHIAIDRGSAKQALTQVVAQGRERLKEGFSVVVFPEGTRTAPGASRPYKVGGAFLAVRGNAPVLPVAHNAGEFWGRHSFLKHPGTITVSIGAPIEVRGRKAEEVNRLAHDWIEAEMRRLFPHHYQQVADSPQARQGS